MSPEPNTRDIFRESQLLSQLDYLREQVQRTQQRFDSATKDLAQANQELQDAQVELHALGVTPEEQALFIQQSHPKAPPVTITLPPSTQGGFIVTTTPYPFITS